MTMTGLLGGSFNPAHGGHRGISIHAAAALGLDEVWWLVSPGNPLKPAEGMASLPVRFASASGAAEGLPVRVTAIERELGTVYTVDTLTQLLSRFPSGASSGSWVRIICHSFTSGASGSALPSSFRLRSFRDRDMMRQPNRHLPWAGCEASSGPQTRLPSGRSGERRRSCCSTCRPTRHPRRPCALPTPIGTKRQRNRSNPQALRDGVTRRPLT
jgi:hypothetical protein